MRAIKPSMNRAKFDPMRRGVSLALLAAGFTSLAATADVASGNVDGDPAALLRDFIRLRTAPGGEPVMWRYAGILVGKPEGEMARPLTRIEGVSYTQATPRADGSIDWQLEEVGYYCGLDDGLPLATLKNPFTGVEVKVAHYRSPQKLRFVGNRIEPGQPLPPGIEFRGEIRRLATVAGRVALTEDLYVRMPATHASETRPARPVRFANSMATFHAAQRDLAPQNSTKWLPCEFSYTTLNSFVPWLGMDSTPGVQDMRITGVKCRADDRSALDGWLRARIAQDHPNFLR